MLLALAAMIESSTAHADAQTWSEFDLVTSVGPRTELNVALLERWDLDERDAVTSAVGVDASVKVATHLTLTGSYYYASSRTSSGRWIDSHLPVLAATLAMDAAPCVFSNRTRAVGVITEGRDFWVYQNRPRLDCRLPAALRGASVFLWDELSYYTLFDDWTRNRLAAGIRVPLGKRYLLDIYYLRQHDLRARSANTDVIGITFGWRL